MAQAAGEAEGAGEEKQAQEQGDRVVDAEMGAQEAQIQEGKQEEQAIR